MATIDAVARNQLQLSKNAAVPASYVLVLQKFLQAYPTDTKFTVHRTSSGHNVLKCLEVGCEGVEIPLGRTPNEVGSIATLEPYKQHIRTHPTHATSRNTRIRRENQSKMQVNAAIGGGRLVAALDRDRLPLQSPITRPLPRISDPVVRKRPSDAVCVELSDSDDDSPPTKRARVASPPKRPLGEMNSNTPQMHYHMQPDLVSQTPFLARSPPHPAFLHGTPASNPLSFHPSPTVTSSQPAAVPPIYSNIGLRQLSGREFNEGWLEDDSNWAVDLQQQSTSYSNRIGPFPILDAQGGWLFLGEDDLDENEDEEENDFPRSYQPKAPSGPRHDEQNIKDFLSYYHQESFGGQKTVQDGLLALGLPELGATLPGMQTSLLAHQVIGVSWMLQREKEDAKWARGGILADAMGLGKTVQSIGIFCANPSKRPDRTGTLIVAPLALLEQWKQEINWKCEEGTFKVLIYHGPNRPKSKHEVMKYDIVLTTYHTLANEWPETFETERKPRKPKKTSDGGFIDDEGEEARTKKQKRKLGPLMDIHWYRVVLDEAQYIRNSRTRASCVVTYLNADIKWCLTGTPFTNGLEDAFGLLRFIEHNPFANWERFRGLIRGYRSENAAKNVQQALAGVLFRRTKESTLDGKPIITLPARNEEWRMIDFQPEERQIYDFVEKKSQAVFNRFLQAGTVLKNYSQILIMLLRLRQLCVHPCLLKAYETAYEVVDTRNESDKNVVEEAARLVSNEFVALVKRKLRETALERIQNERLKGHNAAIEDNCPICFEPFNEDTVIAAPCTHTFCRVCIEAHITRPRGEEDSKYKEHERDCPLCRQTISRDLLFNRRPFEPTDEELEITRSDDHVDSFSWEVDESGTGRYRAKVQKRKRAKPVVDDYSDLEDFIVDDDEEDDRATYKPRTKQKERSVKRKSSRVILSDDEDEEEASDRKPETSGDDQAGEDSSDDELDALVRKRLGAQKAKVRASKNNKEVIVIDSDDEKEETSSQSPNQSRSKPFDPMNRPEMMSSFLPSSKMQYMMKYLQNVAETDPDDKTMIVSQWTSALDLCSDYLSEYGIRYVRYQGDMNARERNESINTFMTKGSVKVMLMSVKCGGVGLNITRACRVISLDPSWAAATDQQCFDRVHRLGQTKDVFIERLMINNTVEQRVRDIQIQKQGLSDAALGEGTCGRVRFTVGELARLFGLDVRN